MSTQFFYDCEFIEDGRTIDLVSIGIATADGREYYAVSSEFDAGKLHADKWLSDNVWSHLPLKQHPPGGHLDLAHPAVKPRAHIAAEVAAFLLSGDGKPELWAWYAAYDHVVLCQLWGRMIDLPDGIPMYTRDLKQEADRLGDPVLPDQVGGEHNALADARHNLIRARALGLVR